MTGPKPTPKPPKAPSPAAVASMQHVVAATPHTPQPEDTARLAAQAREWGGVDSDGNVYVKTADGQRTVGAYPEASEEEALAYFARKYHDLVSQVDLIETRSAIPSNNINDLQKSLATLTAGLSEAAVVGDLAGLAERADRLTHELERIKGERTAQREVAKAEALAGREVIVDKAEKIASQSPSSTQWKQSGDSLKALFDEWKQLQHSGPRVDKKSEDALWKRFSSARNTFDRARRAYFADLDIKRADVAAKKKQLIKQAKELSGSTDWGQTSTDFRHLMDEWKAAGRASRKEDDKLWAEFKAAQDIFFDARKRANEQQDAEYSANLVLKEKLLEEANALLPIRDIDAARSALRDIGERWEAIGHVPRGDMRRVERRLRDIEDALARAEDEKWKRDDPETKARAEGMRGQLLEAISQLETDIAKAESSGNAKKVAELREALDARQSWLSALGDN